ncbi:sensor histidine kinase [Microbacterium sp.]|uniref:sensor histidine kinase n=1 Tax=Microbacterium sp. TaxID=51671 RepID=UPI0039E6CB40
MSSAAHSPRHAFAGVPLGDRARARTVALNQLLLGAVVLVIAVAGYAEGLPGDEGLYFLGVLTIFVATAAAIGLPWNRLPESASAIVPIIDIAAITAMRESTPGASLGLLWIFPAMWLAGSFALPGLYFSIVSIPAIFVASTITSVSELTFGTVLLPIAVVAVATTSYLTARRSQLQRRLLDNQTRLLGEALARARQQEETLTEVFDAVDFGIIRLGRDGRVAVANDAHGRLQLAMEEDDERPPAPVFDRDGITPLDPRDQPLARALRGETFDDRVVWFGAPGENRRALTVTARRLHDDAGADVGSVVVSRDVTAELVAIRAREDLVASVSHELRTPLTSIVGYLDLVLDGELPPSARRGLEVAERNANRLLAIVADILTASVSARSTAELSIEPSDIDVAEIMRSAVELHTPRAAERGIRFDVSGVEPAPAWADPARIRQVLDNLLSNAIKYNVDGGTVEVGTTSDADHAWVVVRDSGIGISETELPRLFDRFFRADAVRKTSTHGSGLGLAISREIVRSHGGEITAQSRPGAGTTFVVRLPAHRHAPEVEKEVSS